MPVQVNNAPDALYAYAGDTIVVLLRRRAKQPHYCRRTGRPPAPRPDVWDTRHESRFLLAAARGRRPGMKRTAVRRCPPDLMPSPFPATRCLAPRVPLPLHTAARQGRGRCRTGHKQPDNAANIHIYNGITKQIRDTSYKLQATSYKLQATSYKSGPMASATHPARHS